MNSMLTDAAWPGSERRDWPTSVFSYAFRFVGCGRGRYGRADSGAAAARVDDRVH